MPVRLAARLAWLVVVGVAALGAWWAAGPMRRAGGGPEAMPPLRGLRVLLVEHDADSRDALSTLLRMEGASVTAVADVPAALVQLARGTAPLAAGGLPAAIVCDIDGPETGALLHKLHDAASDDPRSRRWPVIAVSGACSRHAAGAVAEGFAARLGKPVDVPRLIDALLAACGGPQR